jgi:uncharacterized protein YxeA
MTKKIKIVLSIVIIIFLIVLAAVLWTKENQTDEQKNVDNQGQMKEETNQNSTNDQETEVITSDIDTSDWNTYRNEKYGYELNYDKDKIDIVLDDVFERGTEGNPSFKIKSGGHFTVGVWDNPQSLSTREWLDQKYSDYSGKWLGNYIDDDINGMNIVRAIADNRKSSDPYQCYIEWVIFSKNDKFYTIAGEFCNTGDDSIEVFHEVASTFNFTNL